LSLIIFISCAVKVIEKYLYINTALLPSCEMISSISPNLLTLLNQKSSQVAHADATVLVYIATISGQAEYFISRLDV
jgi:hypothetical protein